LFWPDILLTMKLKKHRGGAVDRLAKTEAGERMNGRTAAAIGIFLLLYASLQGAIGWHGGVWLERVAPAALPVYWALFGVVAFAYLLGRAASAWRDWSLFRWLMVVGAYWMGAMFYLLLLLPIADVAVWLLGALGASSPVAAVGWATVAALSALLALGARNAWSPIARTYRIRTSKRPAGAAPLKIAVASDLHLGASVGRRQLSRLVREINRFEPDVVLLPGDLIDDDLRPFLRRDLASVFRGLRPPRLGVFAVPGNHDPFGGKSARRFAEAMEASGIRMLMDETVRLGGEAVLVGRLDRSAPRYGLARKPLAELLAGADPQMPTILMDHQPLGFAEAEEAGVDLMLSGHTHRGQLAPNHLLTRRLFDLDWGYARKGRLHAVVSSGFGFWGPPFRLGSRAEWIQITLEGEGRE